MKYLINPLKNPFIHLPEILKICLPGQRSIIWCKNTVINILLEDKEQIAHKYGIVFKAALDVPENLSISSPDLCSVFANPPG